MISHFEPVLMLVIWSVIHRDIFFLLFGKFQQNKLNFFKENNLDHKREQQSGNLLVSKF